MELVLARNQAFSFNLLQIFAAFIIWCLPFIANILAPKPEAQMVSEWLVGE